MRLACRCSPFGRGLPSTGSVPPTSGQHSLAASHRALHFTLSPKNSARKTTCSASTVHNIPASALSVPRDRHTYDFFSVCSVVSYGFRLQTPLLNKCTRDLPGLKPTLRLLARAIRGHLIPRFSAFFRGQKNDTHSLAKQPTLPPPFTTFPALLPTSPDTATPTIPVPCLPW